MQQSFHQDIDGHDVKIIDSHPKGRSDKPTAILVHGIGVSSAYFEPFFKQMKPRYRVLALDLPGYGKTEDPKAILTIKELADITNSLVQTNKYPSPVLIGHSMGTQIVTHAVKQQPELYQKYILLAPTINRRERNIFLQAWRLLQDTFKETFKVNLIIFRDYLRMGALRYLITSHFMIADSIEDVISKNQQELLIVNGLDDPICPTDWAHGLAKVQPRAKVVDIPGPHVFQYHHPKELTKICQKFIG